MKFKTPPLSLRSKPLIFALLVGASGAWAQSPPSISSIPAVTSETKPFGMEWAFTEETNLVSPSDGEPQKQTKTGQIRVIFDGARIMVAGGKDFRERWMILEDGVAIGRPWFGGDGLAIRATESPYVLTQAEFPVLPVQLPRLKTFVDFRPYEGRTLGRALGASVADAQYANAFVTFADGRLETADLKWERTRYSDYTGGPIPLPRRMVYERRPADDGRLQTVYTFIGKPLTDPKIPKLTDLVKAPIGAVDYRTNPPRQFVYLPKGPPILKQALSGKPTRIPDRLPDAPGVPLSTLILGGSLALLGGVAVVRLARLRRPKARA